MVVEGLTLIGESINDSIPSTRLLFDAGDIAGLKALAQEQDNLGADYIDVNIGLRPPELMTTMVRELQGVTRKPLSIDTPDPAIAEAGLKAYDPALAGGKLPVLNSITPLRMEMLDLYRVKPFRPVFMVSERREEGKLLANSSARDIYLTAKEMREASRRHGYAIPNEDMIFDPGMPCVGSDTTGMTRIVLAAIRRIHEDGELAGSHLSVGLSNFTVMLPSKRSDGLPVKSALESAFLTLAMPLGLDTVIGSVKRRYATLPGDHPALVCLKEILEVEGYDCITRLMEFYAL